VLVVYWTDENDHGTEDADEDEGGLDGDATEADVGETDVDEADTGKEELELALVAELGAELEAETEEKLEDELEAGTVELETLVTEDRLLRGEDCTDDVLREDEPWVEEGLAAEAEVDTGEEEVTLEETAELEGVDDDAGDDVDDDESDDVDDDVDDDADVVVVDVHVVLLAVTVARMDLTTST